MNNIREFFHVSPHAKKASYPKHRITDTFGYGWKIHVDFKRTDRDGDSMSLMLVAIKNDSYSRPLEVHVTAETLSASGKLVRRGKFTCALSSGNGLGLHDFISDDQWETNAALRQENAITITVSVVAPPGPSARSKRTLRVLHHTIVGKQISQTEFVTFSTRSTTGILSRPRDVLRVYPSSLCDTRHVYGFKIGDHESP